MHGTITSPFEPVLGYAELAAVFRRQRSHIPKTITAWRATKWFPDALPGTHPKLWSAARVREWIDAGSDEARRLLAERAREDAVSGAVPEAVVITAREFLRRKYAGAAA